MEREISQLEIRENLTKVRMQLISILRSGELNEQTVAMVSAIDDLMRVEEGIDTLPPATCEGMEESEDGTSWTSWWLFDNDKIKYHYDYAQREELELEEVLVGFIRPIYRGPGRAFRHSPSVLTGKYHTLVRCSGGLDI